MSTRLTRRLKPATARRLALLVASISAAITVFVVFRLADGLHLVPADRGPVGVLRLVAALFAGIAVYAAPLVPGRLPMPRRIRILMLVWLTAGATLLTLHMVFVVSRTVDRVRVGSRVAFWPPCIENSPYKCSPGESREVCLGGLGYREDRIEACWGGGRILAVKLALALCSLLVSGGFGGLIGLVLARRPEVGAGPLRLFVCYRRADSSKAAKRLHDRLSVHFGADNVTFDVEDTPLGEDFRQAHRHELKRSDVFLLVIGPRWLEIRDDDGTRRLDSPDDRVRIEIEIADAFGLRIVPVLVGGAPMPRADQMPASLQRLRYQSGVRIDGDPADPDDPDFAVSVERLIRQLKQWEEVQP